MQLQVISILNDALSLVGANAADEPATNSDLQLALRVVNVMLDRWSALRLLLRSTQTLTWNTTPGKRVYSIAASGADITAPKPLEVMSGYYVQNGGDTSVEIITREQYDNLSDITASSGAPVYLMYDPGSAQQAVHTGMVYVYYVPDQAYTMNIEVDGILTEFVNVGDVVTFEASYFEPIIYNLAARLWRHFHTKDPIPEDIAALAVSGLDSLRAMNAVRMQAGCDLPGRPGMYNIYTDQA